MMKVAILDTGIDSCHDMLETYINFSLSKSFVDDTIIDNSGHGTGVSGVIIYNELFIPKFKKLELIICKITNNIKFEIASFIEALEYAITLKVRIINLSLSIKKSNVTKKQKDQIEQLIRIAFDKNIIIVASTGNDNQEDNIFKNSKDYIYLVTARDIEGNIASYSKEVKDAYSIFGGDIESIVDYTSIEKHLVVSTFPRYLKNDYFNLFGVPKGYSYFWGTSIATAKFTHVIIKTLIDYNESPMEIKKELNKYKDDLN